MNIRKILFYVLAGILGGCVPVVSLHPLYTQNDIVFDEKLTGDWVDVNEKTTWQFTRPDKEEKFYMLTYCDDENKKGLFAVQLMKLTRLDETESKREEKFFLDAFPFQVPYDSNDPNKAKQLAYNAFFIIPVHIFAIVDSFEPQLRLRLTDDEQMKDMLEEKPKAIKSESVDGRIILTASTEELQKFVLKYADSSELFLKEVILSRKKISDSNEANISNELKKSGRDGKQN